MSLRWTRVARSDLQRLHAFLSAVDPRAALRRTRAILKAVRRIPELPRIGQRLVEYGPREVRRLIVGDYELRYEIVSTSIVVLRVWHVHEDR